MRKKGSLPEGAGIAGEFGIFDTILADGFVHPCPFDNIIVSPNIKIVAAGRIAEPWMNDHAAVWAELIID